MSEYVLSIDPGWSTGVALIGYDNEIVWLQGAWQFTNGLVGLQRWLSDHWITPGWDSYDDEPRSPGFVNRSENYMRLYAEDRDSYDYESDSGVPPADVTPIVEKFTPRPNENFGLTLRAVEPLRCEGVLIDRGLVPDYAPEVKEWRQPKDQYVVGGKDLVDKKKRLHKFLKESGFYVTNKQFPDSPSKDQADDARSSIGHALGYLARVKKHRGALRLMSEWSENNGS
jgi:hypothetical protein